MGTYHEFLKHIMVICCKYKGLMAVVCSVKRAGNSTTDTRFFAPGENPKPVLFSV